MKLAAQVIAMSNLWQPSPPMLRSRSINKILEYVLWVSAAQEYTL
jgi:hypothetical protein